VFGNLFDFFWGLAIIFFWITAIMLWFQCFMDLFRRDDLGGVMKVIWIFVLVAIPWVGALIYLIVRPKVTANDVRSAVRAEAAMGAVASVSTADELKKLGDLKAQGLITDAQFEALKAKLLA